MLKRLRDTSVLATEFAAFCRGMKGLIDLEDRAAGRHRSRVNYQSYFGPKTSNYRRWTFENERGVVSITFGHKSFVSSSVYLKTGTGIAGSPTTRIADFVRALVEDQEVLLRSPLLVDFPATGIEDLPLETQQVLETAFPDLQPSSSVTQELGWALKGIADEHTRLQRIEAEKKRKAADTRARRSAFGKVPDGTLFYLPSYKVGVRKRINDLKTVDLVTNSGTDTCTLSTNLLRHLTLVTPDTVQLLKALSAHERVMGLCAALEGADLSPILMTPSPFVAT